MASAITKVISPWRFVRIARIPAVQLHMTGALMGASVEDFNRAKDKLGTLKKDPGNEVKLKIYALFKQATQGPCNTPKPGMLDFVNKAKWDAWKSLGSVSQEDARQKYVDLISSLVSAESPAVAASPTGSAKAFETLLFTTEDGITTIKFNRPEKKNAITVKMYDELIEALDLAAKDKSVITVLTGSGDYYCSGNDLNNFTNLPEGGPEKMSKDAGELLKRFVSAFIEFPKPLIAVVNGPAVGISVTVLGLFDAVYATGRATFHTPFSHLGQSPEGCSSYTFPAIRFLRNQDFLLSLWILRFNFNGLNFIVFLLLLQSLALSKQLIRAVEKEKLHAVNVAEVERLQERWLSDECMQAIVSFFQAKSKL